MTEDEVRRIVREEIQAAAEAKDEAETEYQYYRDMIAERRAKREARERSYQDEERRNLEARLGELEFERLRKR